MPAPLWVTLPAAFKISDDADEPVVTAALIAILLLAVKVSELPDAQVTALDIVILPELAAADAVVTTTLFAASAVCSVVVFKIDVGVGVVSWKVVAPVDSIELAPVEIVISVGSSNKMPILPYCARVSAAPIKFKCCLPETSTKPPLPLCMPPFAEILPKNCVALSAHTITLPPLPFSVASALSLAFWLTKVLLAFWIAEFFPWKSPPTKIVPPPVLPFTLILPASKIPTFSPSICTLPPLPADDCAEISPLLMTVFAPVSRTIPPSETILSASILPLLLITEVIRPSAARALINTWPPPTLIKLLFSIKVFILALSTCTLIKPLPAKSIVIASPVASIDAPCRALIMPSLRICGENMAT